MSGRRRHVYLVAATLASAALLYFGTGLHPVWWLTWLAPIPVLLLAPRVSARAAAAVAFLAYLLGLANVATYYANDLAIPPPVLVGVFTTTSAIFCGVVLLFRGLVSRGRPLVAVAALASAWAAAEYLFAELTPFGANWTLATTQADVLPVLQITSVTGAWGVSFLVMAVPAAVAAVAAPRQRNGARVRAGVAAGVALLVALTYGAVRLHEPTDASVARVAAVAARLPGGTQPRVDTPAGRSLLAADVEALRALAGRAEFVVFPEKDVIADDDSLPRLVGRFTAAARESRLVAVVGVELRTHGTFVNAALVFPADGSSPIVYRKRYLLPGAETDFRTGHARTFVPGYAHRVAVAICADMGHPDLGRDNARAGAHLMLVPALDFDVDAWSQSRVQYMRGVENGFSVVRSSRRGNLTLVDDNGRVLDETRADTPARLTVVTADVPLGEGTTPYTRWGDWFAWLSLVLTALGLICLIPRRGRSSRKAEVPLPDRLSRGRR